MIRQGQEPLRSKKKRSYKFKEYAQDQIGYSQTIPETMPITKKKKWKATKEQIINYWQGLRDDVPISIKPISYEHKGSTYGEDGIRLTGSPEFIASVLPRLRELLAYETPTTKLALVYRETESPSKLALGSASKTSYVFYLQVKERGHNQ